jgi:hypothetical protein
MGASRHFYNACQVSMNTIESFIKIHIDEKRAF